LRGFLDLGFFALLASPEFYEGGWEEVETSFEEI